MFRIALAFFGAALLAFSLIPDPAQAQPARVFVAAQGNDANPCTFAQPCRTFQHAHDTVAAGGEIDVLDPAGYGAVSNTKAISIQGHGFAGLAVPSGDGITIKAGASDKINLRGLLLDGVGTGSNGIVLNSGLMLNVQDSVIRGFTGNGISFLPTVASVLLVSNTLLSANALSGGQGVLVAPPSGSAVVQAVLDHVQIDNGFGAGLVASGLNSTGSIPITLSNSVVANNGAQGVSAISSNGNASVTVMVSNSSVVNSGDAGLWVQGSPTTLRVTQSVITGNLIGWLNFGGTLQSYGDNRIDSNAAANNAPPGTPLK